MIIIRPENSFSQIASLCLDNWDLSDQIEELKKWLNQNISKTTGEKLVADIGFSIRANAAGGGAVIDLDLIDLLAKAKMEVYFSEYDNSDERKQKK